MGALGVLPSGNGLRGRSSRGALARRCFGRRGGSGSRCSGMGAAIGRFAALTGVRTCSGGSGVSSWGRDPAGTRWVPASSPGTAGSEGAVTLESHTTGRTGSAGPAFGAGRREKRSRPATCTIADRASAMRHRRSAPSMSVRPSRLAPAVDATPGSFRPQDSTRPPPGERPGREGKRRRRGAEGRGRGTAVRRGGQRMEPRPVRRQDMGTCRRILPSMRSKMSSRFGPVMVRPWFFSPMTARAGSGDLRTSSATAWPSCRVPHG